MLRNGFGEMNLHRIWLTVFPENLRGRRYYHPTGSIITVEDGQHVGSGEVLARIPQESSKTRDITGGLPRVAELFEARSPKDKGTLAEITGTVSFGLVSIPVDLVPAVREGRVALRMLDKDGTPLSRRYYCPNENREVHPEHIMRGYEEVQSES